MNLEQFLLSECRSLYEMKVGIMLLKGIRHQPTISKETGISKRNVFRALAALKHYVVSHETPMGVSPDTSLHNVVSPETPVSPQTPYNVVSPETPAEVSPETPTRVSHQTPHNIGGVSPDTTPAKERKKEPKKERNNNSDIVREEYPPTPQGGAGVPPDTKEDDMAEKYRQPSREECEEYFASHGSTIEEGAKFYNWYSARDWLSGKTRIAYWKLQAKIWMADKIERQNGTSIKMAPKPKEPWQVKQDEAFIREKQSERWRIINSRNLLERLSGKLDHSDREAIKKVFAIQEMLDKFQVKYDFKIVVNKEGGYDVG